MNDAHANQLSEIIGPNISFLRRYARALSGSQERGDSYAAATIEALVEAPELFDQSLDPKTALFAVFHGIWTKEGGKIEGDETGLKAKAQGHLERLTDGTREALLLSTIEDFSVAEVAHVLSLSEKEAQELIDVAYKEMGEAVSGSILIIEDEAIIALDLEAIISDMGHRATGVARTETGAIDLFARDRPDLILSDIRLADGSSGVDAVRSILKDAGQVPVIFVSAYPEQLLTGMGPEPAFLIAKPYTEAQIRSAISQAMFFSSTEPLQN
ncbi:MAG: response regulator [Rhodobacteraceae bacterium]|nr:response regulator [Paracoccaceae bacterium]